MKLEYILVPLLLLVNVSEGKEKLRSAHISTNCRSNATHVAWLQNSPPCNSRKEEWSSNPRGYFIQQSKSRRTLEDGENAPLHESCCTYQTVEEAQQMAYQYLRRHIMSFDLPFRSTLGFADKDDGLGSNLPDGLDGGLVGPTIECALQAKQNYTWADAVPIEIFHEFVLNYANVNEARSNWRPLLLMKLQRIFWSNSTAGTIDASIATLPVAVLALNTQMWKLLAPSHVDSIVFVSGQTPLIFDPMSVLSFGYASCTGLAILMVNALRTFGIPARVVGTPAWQQLRGSGNHNWVEVWHQGQWHFLEPSATRTTDVDHLYRNPCERWFCHPDRFTNNSSTTTKVFAARLESSPSSNTFYRMAWEWENSNVPGEDVTAYYQATCSKC